MKLSISKSKDVVSEASGGSKFIGSSGIYDIKINFASISVADSGAESVNFNITYNDNTQTLWGPYVTNKNGEDNEIGSNLILKLGIIAGLDEGDELSLADEVHEVGKDNKEMEFTVIEQFSDLECKVHVKEEYSMYNNKIVDRLSIQGFYREDGASAEEIVNDADFGARLEQTLEKYASAVTYRDGLTADDIEQWKANGRGKGGASGATKPKSATIAKKKAMFTRK